MKLAILAVFVLFISAASFAQSGQLLSNAGAAPIQERLHHIAERYAPFIYHATDDEGGRQDILSNIDFDGDLVGNNNWENFDRYKLNPTVYYAVLETETHYFLSFHLFHPRDWNHFTIYLNDTHENDGENFQVVVRKSDERVVLLWTQAHYLSDVYANPGDGIKSGKTSLDGEILLLDDNGAPSDSGTHAAVFVEAQGHGIYGALDGDDVVVQPDGSFMFDDGSGILFRAARSDEIVEEPSNITSGTVPYKLDSMTMKLWPLLRDGQLTGDGKLLDGTVTYSDELITIDLPRYYDANRFSGPFGHDRGISPFALDFSFSKPTLGALFFNPAKRYPEQLKITGEWSTQFIQYPFTR